MGKIGCVDSKFSVYRFECVRDAGHVPVNITGQLPAYLKIIAMTMLTQKCYSLMLTLPLAVWKVGGFVVSSSTINYMCIMKML